MTNEFDKEIDALLRHAAQGETAFAVVGSKSSHLDADEISAFAENALPENVKRKYTIHFADCSRCRSILSNLIALNAETQVEIVQPLKTEKAATAIPWYRKLFAYPNLAYTMGALVLAFSGLIAYVVLQNDSASPGFEISQISEPTEKAQAPSFEQVTPTEESFSNSMMSNSMMSSASPNISEANAAPVLTENKTINALTANSNMSVSAPPKVPANESSRAEISQNNFALSPNNSNLQAKIANSNITAKEKEEIRKEDSQNKKAETLKDADSAKPAPNSYNVQLPIQERNTADNLLSATAKKKAQKTSETTSVSGKSFKRANNVWIDSTYKGQSTTNISRGTNEYKKLDSGLRSIVEDLGGTVVVVWKEKAYRIQ